MRRHWGLYDQTIPAAAAPQLRRKKLVPEGHENVAWARATGKPVRRALLAASIIELLRRRSSA